MPTDPYGRYRLISRAIVLPPIKGRPEAAHVVGVGDRVTMQRAMRGARQTAEQMGYVLADSGPNHAVYVYYIREGKIEGIEYPRLNILSYLVTDELLHRDDLLAPALEVIK
jgi:hypothetical protein